MSTKDNDNVKKPRKLKPSDRQNYIDQLIEEVEIRGSTPSTIRGYVGSVNKFLDFYKDLDPQDLGLPGIKKFQRIILKRSRPSAKHSEPSYLWSEVFLYACTWQV